MRAGGAGPSRRVRRFVAPALLAATLVSREPRRIDGRRDERLLDELTRQVLQVRQQSLNESVNQLRFILEEAQQSGDPRTTATQGQLMLQYGRMLNRLDEARRRMSDIRRE